jgi:V/A-type H+-transporting ATPase subunit B
MPAGDITHPVPDLTGYITEGQIVLSAEAHAQGVYPPVDPLASLSRLMRRGTGAGRTRADHPDIAAQLLSALARTRQVRELAELVGAEGLTPIDHAYLDLDRAFHAELVDQGQHEARAVQDTLERVWRVLLRLPRSELAMLPAALLDARAAPPREGTEPGRQR